MNHKKSRLVAKESQIFFPKHALPFWLGLLSAAILQMAVHTKADTNVVVSFSTLNPTRLNAGFSGFNFELGRNGTEYYDTNLQQFAKTLSPGWLRYPGGSMDDAFDWTNGLELPNWVNQFSNEPSAYGGLQSALVVGTGKGGLHFTDFTQMCSNLGGARIVVVVNGFTDSANSAGAFAQYALSNHISVAAWELCNEPYLFYGVSNSQTSYFWTNSTDYLNSMRPYRDAIKRADPNAKVGIFYSPPTHPDTNWDMGISHYTDKYWDTVSIHDYPFLVGSSDNFTNLMKHDNWNLVNNTATYLTNFLMPQNSNNVTYMVTEYSASGSGAAEQTGGTLYGGVYAVEYAMRMSTLPQMIFVGTHQLLDYHGIGTTNDQKQACETAYFGHYTTNTIGLPYGYYFNAQALGQAVANVAFANSSEVYATTTSGGPTVMTNSTGNAIPAVYAQVYRSSNGRFYVLLTNKGATNALATLVQNGITDTNQYFETYVSGGDPTATNSFPGDKTVQIQYGTNVSNPFVVPAYSVLRLEFMQALPVLTNSIVNGNCLVLQWPKNQGLQLESQTGALSSAMGTNWIPNPGATSPFTNKVDPTIPAVFYRLRQ